MSTTSIPQDRTTAMQSAVRDELAAICDRFAAGEKRLHQAQTMPAIDRAQIAAAHAECDEAKGDFWAAGQQLADLLLLLWRYAIRHQPDALRDLVKQIIGPLVTPIAQAVAKLERRVGRLERRP